MKTLGRKRKETLTFFIFLMPWIIGFIGLTLIPMIASLYLSLTEWNVLSNPIFIGLDNFRNIFQDEYFYKSIKVTLTYTAFTVPLNIIISLCISMLLNNNLKGMNVFRTIFYLPAIISGVVIAIVWLSMYNPEFGLINSLLSKIGIKGPDWVYSEEWALPSLIIMSLWNVGSNIVLYLSGLQSVPTDLYEASHIDGAGFWARFRYITLPGISPVLFFSLLTGIINSLQTFTQAFVMTEGGPNNATNFYAYYIYNNAFVWRKMGEACAQAWILFVIIFILTYISTKATQDKVYYDSKEGGSLV